MRPTICIVGSALNTGNLGVQALGVSTVLAMHKRLPHARFVVLNGGTSCQTVALPTGDGSIEVETIGASLSRRFWKRGNLSRERLLHRIGCGRLSGIVTRALANADLVLDISGGDSFTTMYGEYRYHYVTSIKRHVQRLGTPFVLLPQTYGPFNDAVRDDVRSLLRGAVQIWARDEDSRRTAQMLAWRKTIDLAADVAFTLPAPPKAPIAVPYGRPLVGINISGLLYNAEPADVCRRFGLQCDYRGLMQRIVEDVLDHENAHVLFVPHVIAGSDHVECDATAIRRLRSQLPHHLRDRTTAVWKSLNAQTAKALIAQCDFLIGSRMHACIAALSSGVPACAIAYSDKTQGVFESVGMGNAVCDPRSQWITQVRRQVSERLLARDIDAVKLKLHLPSALASVERMFDSVASLVKPTHRPATLPQAVAA